LLGIAYEHRLRRDKIYAVDCGRGNVAHKRNHHNPGEAGSNQSRYALFVDAVSDNLYAERRAGGD
jgi:hypothetical protein